MTETYVALIGMVKQCLIFHHIKYCYKFNVLPEQVKTELNFTEKFFNEEFVSLETSYEVSKHHGNFNQIYYTYCSQNKLHKVLNQNKLKTS